MLLPIRAICKEKWTRRDGTAPIFLLIFCCFECQYAGGIKILVLSIAELPNQFGDAEKLNDELLRLKRLVEDLMSEATRKQIADKGAFVKKAFTHTLDLQALDERVTTVAKQEIAKKEAKQDIYYQFDEYIKTKERKVSKATLTCIW